MVTNGSGSGLKLFKIILFQHGTTASAERSKCVGYVCQAANRTEPITRSWSGAVCAHGTRKRIPLNAYGSYM